MDEVTKSPQPIKRSSTCFPYVHHFPQPHKVKKVKQGFQVAGRDLVVAGKVLRPLKESTLRSLREQLEALLDLAKSADYVATFALGGLVPLNYLVRRLEVEKLSHEREKFHLFAGLDWRAKKYNVEARFLLWLDDLPDDSHVLIFDTGSVGNAAGRIRNAIAKQYRDGKPMRNLTITVAVVAVASTIGDEKPRTIRSIRTGRVVSISSGFLRVPSTDFEDALYLQGYQSLRDEGRVSSIAVGGSFMVEFDDGNRSAVASADTAGAFLKLLLEDGILSVKFLKTMNPGTWPGV